jgi:ATP-dependent helicase HrpB
VLVFLPGAYEIRRTIDALRRLSGIAGWDILPLYGELSPKDQDAAVAKSGRRKIVVSTNVAETSLTIDGVRVVIDSGLARVADFDARRGINTLTVQKISRASAEQRAGRAGRTAPGVCLRLWSERDHAGRSAAQAPEVQRLELSETMLSLAAAGCDLGAMRWLDPPGDKATLRATALLCDLGAIDREGGGITAVGRRMVAFPAHPRFGRMLVEAERWDCVAEAALCAAVCQGRDLFIRGRSSSGEFAGPDDISDFQPLLRAWLFAKRAGFNVSKCDPYGINAAAAREAGAVMGQLLKVAERQGMPVLALGEKVPAEALAKVVLSGFSDNVGRRLSAGTLSCELVGGRRGKVRKESIAASSDVLVATEIAEIEGKEVSVTLSRVTGLELGWLRELFPDDFEDGEGCRFDPATRRVVNEKRVMFRDLVLESRVSGEAPKDRAAEVLADEVVAGNLVLKGWDGKCDSWLARVACLRAHLPEYDFPEFTDDDRLLVVAEVCYGARGYKEIKDRPVWPALRKWLSAAQTAAVESLAPERVTLSNGRDATVTYLGGEPMIAMVLQRLYDVDRTPMVGGGKIPVVVDILGPNQRPVQRTKDLGGFWANSYPEVRKQLKGRYPKHEWR